MPIIQHTGTAFASGGGDLNWENPSTLQVWLDPRNWSSLTQSSDAAFGAGSQSSGNWRIMNGDAQYVAGTNDQGVEPAVSNTNMATITYGNDVPGMRNVTNYTFQFWIYVGTQTHGSWGYIGGSSNFWGNRTAGIFIQSNGTDWGFHTSSDGALDNDMPANGWHNVCGVRNISAPNCRMLFVDGSVVRVDNNGDNDSSHILDYSGGLSVLCHSNSNATGTGYTVGQTGFKFGHCLFYSSALSEAQVLSNYNMSKSVYGL